MGPLPNHGTKVLGAIVTAIGLATTTYADALTNLLGPRAPGVMMMLAGLLTVLRGFQNSVNDTSGNVGTITTQTKDPTPPPKVPPRASVWLLLPFLAMLVSVTTFTGCASLGLAAPKTFNEKLAVGYGTATAVLQTTDTLLNAGKIDARTAQNIEAQEVNLKAALDIAAYTEVANAADGGNKLATAMTALNALSQYLTTLQGSK